MEKQPMQRKQNVLSPMAGSRYKTQGERKESLLSGEVQNRRRIKHRQELDSVGLGGHQTREGEKVAKSQHLLALTVCSVIHKLSSSSEHHSPQMLLLPMQP